jgi:hypothetical protein
MASPYRPVPTVAQRSAVRKTRHHALHKAPSQRKVLWSGELDQLNAGRRFRRQLLAQSRIKLLNAPSSER